MIISKKHKTRIAVLALTLAIGVFIFDMVYNYFGAQ